MPQPSIPYASARISALGKGILDQQTIRRMADSSLEDVVRTLQEVRYGGISDGSADDCERMIENVRIRTAQEIAELSPKPKITDLFLLQTDVQNLKILIKARLLETDAELLEGGIYPTEKLKRMVADQDYRDLPEVFQSYLHTLEQKLKVEIEPQQVSVLLDKAYLAHALAVAGLEKDAFAEKYFRALADFNNIITMLRLRAMNAPKEDLKSLLLPAGKISNHELTAAYDVNMDALSHAFSAGDAHRALAEGLAKVQQLGSLAALERARDDYLLSLVKAHKHDSLSIYPILGYWFARDREAKAIRLIVTVKRNGLDDAIIHERLCELYG